MNDAFCRRKPLLQFPAESDREGKEEIFKNERNMVDSTEHDRRKSKRKKKKKKKERTKYVTLSIDGYGVFVKVCSGTTKNPLLARKLTVNYN